MDNLQAPWIGLCREDYMRLYDKSIVCTCERCGRFIREDDDYYETEDGIVCEECLSEGEEDDI